MGEGVRDCEAPIDEGAEDLVDDVSLMDVVGDVGSGSGSGPGD